MRKLVSGAALAAVLAVGGVAISGCATEQYVDEQVAVVAGQVTAVNGRVDALSGRVDGVEAAARAAQQRADEAAALARGKFNVSVVSDTDSVLFDTGSYELSDEAKATLTAFAERLKGENRNVWIEVQGYADPRGSVAFNRDLGARRAAEVRRFLVGQGVPAHRVEALSWGEERQLSSGQSADELAAERRVVLIVVG